MTNYADPSTVAAKAATWTPQQLRCRIGGAHSWWAKGKTYLSHYTKFGVMVVRQRCDHGCRVEREAEMDPTTGRILSAWRPDYSRSPNYLMQDDDRKSLGRIAVDDKGVLILQFIQGMPVTEVEDDDE